MGPPPRSLAAEADGCFMVWPDGANRIQGRGAILCAYGGLPSVRPHIASIDHVAVDLMDNAAR